MRIQMIVMGIQMIVMEMMSMIAMMAWLRGILTQQKKAENMHIVPTNHNFLLIFVFTSCVLEHNCYEVHWGDVFELFSFDLCDVWRVAVAWGCPQCPILVPSLSRGVKKIQMGILFFSVVRRPKTSNCSDLLLEVLNPFSAWDFKRGIKLRAKNQVFCFSWAELAICNLCHRNFFGPYGGAKEGLAPIMVTCSILL